MRMWHKIFPLIAIRLLLNKYPHTESRVPQIIPANDMS